MPFSRMHEDWEQEVANRKAEEKAEQEKQKEREERDCSICDVWEDTVEKVKDWID
jgi:hypothetical protein